MDILDKLARLEAQCGYGEMPAILLESGSDKWSTVLGDICREAIIEIASLRALAGQAKPFSRRSSAAVSYDCPLNMHLRVKGMTRVSVCLGDDATVRLFWRFREGEIYEPDIQEVKFVNGEWVAGESRGPLIAKEPHMLSSFNEVEDGLKSKEGN